MVQTYPNKPNMSQVHALGGEMTFSQKLVNLPIGVSDLRILDPNQRSPLK